jgi:putative PIN family toxin of toxin-antitoxin system
LIVFDVSTLIGAVIKRDAVPHRAIQRALGTDGVALSHAMEAELLDVLNRPRLARFIDPALMDEVLTALLARAIRLSPLARIRDCRDPGDDKYLELALAARARLIVSSDADLLALDPWRGIRILNPAAYLAAA